MQQLPALLNKQGGHLYVKKRGETMARQTNRDIFRSIEQRIQKSQRKYERQGFTVNLPSWYTELQQRATEKGKRFTKKMLSEAEKLAKSFKKTTIPKAERQAEKQRKKEEREAQKQYFKDYWNKFYKKEYESLPAGSYDEYEEDDELFHPQYEDEYYEEELPDESSAVLQEVITALEDLLANGSKTADELLMAIQTAIDTEGQRAVAKGIASVGKDLKDALSLMGYIEKKQDYTGAFAFQSKAMSLITKGIYGVEELSKVRENNYGL